MKSNFQVMMAGLLPLDEPMRRSSPKKKVFQDTFSRPEWKRKRGNRLARAMRHSAGDE